MIKFIHKVNDKILVEVPTDEWIASVGSDAWATPDIRELEKRAKHLVFFYDDYTRNGFPQVQSPTYGGKYCCTAFTYDPFVLWKEATASDVRAFILRESFKGDEKCRVKGKIFSITTDSLVELDSYMFNELEYTRERLEFIYPFREQKKGKKGPLQYAILPAFIYVGIPGYWLPLIDGGYFYSKVRRFDPQNPICFNLTYTEYLDIKRYYAFTKEEYED